MGEKNQEINFNTLFFEYIDGGFVGGWSLGGGLSCEIKQLMNESYTALEGEYEEYYFYITLLKWQFTIGYRTKLKKLG